MSATGERAPACSSCRSVLWTLLMESERHRCPRLIVESITLKMSKFRACAIGEQSQDTQHDHTSRCSRPWLVPKVCEIALLCLLKTFVYRKEPPSR